MKTIHTLIALIFIGTVTAKAEESFVPRLRINHKSYIDEALFYLLKERPNLKADNLEFISLNYFFQPMSDTAVECGPNGCIISPAAPFQETLYLSFKIKDSKRQVIEGGRSFILHDTLNIQFPTPRMNDWSINEGTTRQATSVDPKNQ